MITFILIALFVILGIGLAIVAYGANQRRRAGQSGRDSARGQQEIPHPRATPPDA